MNLMKHGETYVLALTAAEFERVHAAIVAGTGVQMPTGAQRWYKQMDDDLNRLRHNLKP